MVIILKWPLLSLYRVLTLQNKSENKELETLIENQKTYTVFTSPSSFDSFIKNYNKGLNNFGLYEVGPIYLGSKEEEQISCSAGIRSGSVLERHWAIEDREFDIYDSKKDAYKAMEAAGINLRPSFPHFPFNPDFLQ